MVHAKVAEHPGWETVRVYEDIGISGAKGRDKRRLTPIVTATKECCPGHRLSNEWATFLNCMSGVVVCKNLTVNYRCFLDLRQQV